MHKIILDTDYSMGYPGSDVDDGFALALAHAEREIDLVCVTTVFGNAPVASCTALVQKGLRQLGVEHRVITGAEYPFLYGTQASVGSRRADTAGGVPHAATEIRNLVLSAPGELTVVAIGPLTNVALALMLDPAVAHSVKEVVIMGGAFSVTTGTGRTWPGEFNVWNDPIAAQIVLNSGVPQRWIGLDVTTRVTLTTHDLDALDDRSAYLRHAKTAGMEWIAFLAEEFPGQYGTDEIEVHDATALAALTHPEWFTWADVDVQVGTENNKTRGITVVDFLKFKGAPPGNCTIATDVDAEALKAYLVRQFNAITPTD